MAKINLLSFIFNIIYYFKYCKIKLVSFTLQYQIKRSSII
uniref:Uncharacterized protein n=1 Tax=Siphoviridae sp. ctlHU7 TaxID=2827588 RepID=A0A8S5LI19_9CAUD|nr:MAG TPA: hypothetical protein [Siphoviridae sp. ctlHU7]